MWLKLGNHELLNLDHVYSIRKWESLHMDIFLRNQSRPKRLSFENEASRDAAFDSLFENLQKIGQAME